MKLERTPLSLTNIKLDHNNKSKFYYSKSTQTIKPAGIFRRIFMRNNLSEALHDITKAKITNLNEKQLEILKNNVTFLHSSVRAKYSLPHSKIQEIIQSINSNLNKKIVFTKEEKLFLLNNFGVKDQDYKNFDDYWDKLGESTNEHLKNPQKRKSESLKDIIIRP